MDKKALIKAIKMNERPSLLSSQSDIPRHNLTIRIIDQLGPGAGYLCLLKTCQFPLSVVLNGLIIEF